MQKAPQRKSTSASSNQGYQTQANYAPQYSQQQPNYQQPPSYQQQPNYQQPNYQQPNYQQMNYQAQMNYQPQYQLPGQGLNWPNTHGNSRRSYQDSNSRPTTSKTSIIPPANPHPNSFASTQRPHTSQGYISVPTSPATQQHYIPPNYGEIQAQNGFIAPAEQIQKAYLPPPKALPTFG